MAGDVSAGVSLGSSGWFLALVAVDPRAMRRIAVLSTFALATLAACGGDSESTSSTTAATEDTAGGADASTVEPTVAPTDTTDTTETDDTSAPGDTTEVTGGGEPADDEGAYVDAIMAGYSGDGEDEARCIAEAAVNGVGLEQLQSAGVSPEALAQTPNFAELGVTFDDPAAVEAALVDCGDGYLVLTLSQTERTDASEACADEHISDEVVARVLVQSLNGEDPDAEAQAAADAFDACVQEAEGE